MKVQKAISYFSKTEPFNKIHVDVDKKKLNLMICIITLIIEMKKSN